MRILVAVCTYNEADNIHEVLTRIITAVPEADVLVVDDDSPDQTSELVEQFSRSCDGQHTVRCLVRHERGLGGAIRQAMKVAVEERYDLFCNLDADLSHDPADLPGLIDLIASAKVDIAVGSRYVPGGDIVGWPMHRKWMSRTINAVARRKLGLPVNDASGSFRCYRVSRLAELDLDAESSDGYSFLQEVLLRLHRSGATMAELPIRFTERIAGDSKLNFREAIRSGWTVFRLGASDSK
ncbi:polyprenol monophosphomannose synthase [Neorhodopirellula pilleata]|uniref:Undecaprenyl-phosphate mannosyltransferase n=1 Tax=Neorhodopirellula pilleata TaxID=2714738 RepID=A0A5C6A360_9BACT|nr:polyprenol monophosphomannose synthase [Neorhodopirellula pilleata]TWT94342.1 Undecaprenyl-phosphate mannosyltransferase [Neorhodopirellula pilleata]